MADGGSTPLEPAPTLPSVYLDTSVPSYLTSRRTHAMPMARYQLVTCLWWNGHRSRFRVYASADVVDEARKGNVEAARRRVAVLLPLAKAAVTQEALDLANRILLESGLPVRAKADAQHIAIAAANGIDYLLTWNCKHLANPQITPKVARTCRREGFRPPEICTPETIIRRVVYVQSPRQVPSA
jgi:predicted nucleic acid-binding protein